jgi:polar amino acid transport system substrate-binding protein
LPQIRSRWIIFTLAVVAAVLAGVTLDRVIVPGLGLTGLTVTGQQLPAAIQQSTVIRVASSLNYPGVEAPKPGTKQIEGIDIDLCQAIAQRFGKVRCEFVDTPTAALIPTLLSGKADIIMSGLGDSVAREQVIDLIDYYSSGLAFVVPKADVAKYPDTSGFCGRGVSVQFQVQQQFAEDLSAMCKAARKPSLNIVVGDLTALERGKVDAALADYATAVQVVRRQPGFALAGKRLVQYPTNPQKIVAPWGIGVRKNDSTLRTALLNGLRAVIADGTYDRILARWGATPGSLKTAQINCASTATCLVAPGG